MSPCALLRCQGEQIAWGRALGQEGSAERPASAEGVLGAGFQQRWGDVQQHGRQQRTSLPGGKELLQKSVDLMFKWGRRKIVHLCGCVTLPASLGFVAMFLIVTVFWVSPLVFPTLYLKASFANSLVCKLLERNIRVVTV